MDNFVAVKITEAINELVNVVLDLGYGESFPSTEHVEHVLRMGMGVRLLNKARAACKHCLCLRTHVQEDKLNDVLKICAS